MPVKTRRRREEEDEETTKRKGRAATADKYTEDEEDEETDGPDLAEMDRSELKALIRERELDIRVLKSMSDDDLREAIEEALANADEDEDEDDDDEEDDDEDGEGRPNVVGKGWKSFKDNKAKTSSFPTRFTPDEENRLIKFIEDEPFATYNQHWIDGRPGKKSFICIGDDCPLCNIGDRPTPYAVFNIIDLSEDAKGELKTLEARPTLAGLIEVESKDKRFGPLTKGYYSIRRTGKKGKVTTTIKPVKVRDVEEDFDVKPLSDAALAAFEKKAWDDTSVATSTRKELREIAREIGDDD